MFPDYGPGGPLAHRPLHFIWILDCSGSMVGAKIQALNTAIREALPHMRRVANENPHAEVLVRAVRFSSGASWHVPTPTPVQTFRWDADLTADGVTDMGAAFELVASQLAIPPMPDRALPPVLVLVSDGQPTDNWQKGLQTLLSLPWGKKAVRLAIAIGEDADEEPLQQFIGHSELKPLRANNADTLVNYIKWASTAVLAAASAPPSQVSGSQSAPHVPIPQPPGPADATDVW